MNGCWIPSKIEDDPFYKETKRIDDLIKAQKAGIKKLKAEKLMLLGLLMETCFNKQ